MPYTNTTLSDFRTALQRRWEEAQFWTDDEARMAINESLREWNLLTGRWRERVSVTAFANDPTIELGGSLVFGMRVRVETQPLTLTSTIELDLARPQWRMETTASGGDVPTAPIHWAPISLQQIVIWPAIAASHAIPTVLVDGIAATPVLVEDADYVDIGEEIIDVLAEFALHIAAFKEGGPRWRRTKIYWRQFLRAAAEENSLLKSKQAFRRYAGLDRRRDLIPTTGVPTRLDTLGNNRHPNPDSADQEQLR